MSRTVAARIIPILRRFYGVNKRSGRRHDIHRSAGSHTDCVKHTMRDIQQQQVRHFFNPRKWWSSPYFSEIDATMRYMDRHMRELDRDLNRVLGEIERVTAFPVPRVRLWDEAKRGSPVGIEVDDEGNRKFQLRIDVSQYRPEEVKITIKDRLLTVYAKHIETKHNGSKFYQEYCREYTLPPDVKTDDVRSLFTPLGTLVIEAPLPPAPEYPKETEIPIQVITGEDDKMAKGAGDKKTKGEN